MGSEADSGRRGRPPQLTREQIVQVVARLPAGQLSMALVAEELGVSASGLYHHVKGRDELLEIAANSAAQDLQPPADTGQHWSEWWIEYCTVMREGLKLHPDVLRRVRGSHPGLVDRLEIMLGVMDRSGFEPKEAITAIDTLSNWLYGFVWREVEVMRESEAGRPSDLELIRVLRQRPGETLPHTRRMVKRQQVPDPDQEFIEQLSAVIAGIAARRGESIESVRLMKNKSI